MTPLRVFQRGHAPTTVDPLPSCCKQGSPEGMLEQESAVQVEGGKGRVRCVQWALGPAESLELLSPDLICHFSSISVSPMWDCAQPSSAGTCEKPQVSCSLSPAQHRPRDSAVLATELSFCFLLLKFHLALNDLKSRVHAHGLLRRVYEAWLRHDTQNSAQPGSSPHVLT